MPFSVTCPVRICFCGERPLRKPVLPVPTTIAWSKVIDVAGAPNRRSRLSTYCRAASTHATWLRLRASFAACCLLMLASCSVATVTSAITPMMMSDASIAPPRGLRMMLSPYVRHEHGTGEQIRSLLGELED